MLQEALAGVCCVVQALVLLFVFVTALLHGLYVLILTRVVTVSVRCSRQVGLGDLLSRVCRLCLIGWNSSSICVGLMTLILELVVFRKVVNAVDLVLLVLVSQLV